MSEVKTDSVVNVSGDNDSGIDLSTNDVVAIKTANSERVRVASDGKVGIGDTTPDDTLTIYGGTQRLRVGNSDSNHVRIGRNSTSGNFEMMRTTTGATDQVFFKAVEADDGNVILQEGGGNVLVGKTDTSTASEGAVFGVGELQSFTRNGNTVLRVRRNTDGGDTIQIYQDGDLAGAIGSVNVSSGERLTIGDSNTKLRFNNGAGEITPCGNGGGNRDNVIDLGDSGARFDDIHATNGTIQTSDQNEKQDIASLTTAEMTAAKAISKLFKTFKWQDKVAAKGDAARTHTGVIAQEVQTAMSDAGLDASKYAFWCSDTWWEDDETYTDDDGAEQTRTNTYDTADEAPEGATQRTRLGVRYPELLAFIGAATEQRLADLETRVTALEDA